jgi:hypothetical protein
MGHKAMVGLTQRKGPPGIGSLAGDLKPNGLFLLLPDLSKSV